MRNRLFASAVASLAGSAALLLSGSIALADESDRHSVDPTFGPDATVAGTDTIEGELAIDVRDDATAADLADLSARYGVTMRPSSAWSTTHDKLEIADVDPAREDAVIEALSGDPRIEHVEPMAIYRETFVPDDPLYASKQWNLRRVGAEKAWSYSCGQGVTVAVIDTGVACFDKGPFSRGTDLAGTRCEGGWNFVTDTREAYDDQGHGTHVAGTIAQTTHNGVGAAGLAFCASLMPVKVLNKQGFGSVANVAEGIRFAADEGAQIINLSLGGPIKSGILKDAVDHALARGVVIVAAAGNSGKRVGWPAAYPGVVAVSATDDTDTIAWFSSRGPEVGIAAPGVGVTQQTICNGGRDKCEIFGTFNGTSMASPHVAGVAAMIEALGVTRADAVRDALFGGARAPTAGSDPNLYGAGILDGGAATSRVFWSHWGLRALALLGLGLVVRRRIGKRGGCMTRHPGAWFGTALASVGILSFAPLAGWLNQSGRARDFVELAMRPLGEWDGLLWGAGAHQWLLLASALPTLALAAIGFRSRHLRPLIGGIALGSAALLVQMAWSGDAGFVAGAFLARVWEVANALVCLWLARVALEDKKLGDA
jgi:serine protease